MCAGPGDLIPVPAVLQGPDALYVVHGEALAAEVRAAGGVMTAQDLLGAQPLVKDAISIQVGRRGTLCATPCNTAHVLAVRVRLTPCAHGMHKHLLPVVRCTSGRICGVLAATGALVGN